MKQNLYPENRVFMQAIMNFLMTMLPQYQPFITAMLSGEAIAPAPAEPVNDSNEMKLHKLNLIEKHLYTSLISSQTRFDRKMFGEDFWGIVWASIDIRCPHGVAIRDGYQVVRLSADSNTNGLISKNGPPGKIIWSSRFIHPNDIPAFRELATTLLARLSMPGEIPQATPEDLVDLQEWAAGLQPADMP